MSDGPKAEETQKQRIARLNEERIQQLNRDVHEPSYIASKSDASEKQPVTLQLKYPEIKSEERINTSRIPDEQRRESVENLNNLYAKHQWTKNISPLFIPQEQAVRTEIETGIANWRQEAAKLPIKDQYLAQQINAKIEALQEIADRISREEEPSFWEQFIQWFKDLFNFQSKTELIQKSNDLDDLEKEYGHMG